MLFVWLRCKQNHISRFSIQYSDKLTKAGPLFLSPLSEMYGRRVVLNISTSFFVLFQIGCALAPSLPALICFRLLTGIGGSACLTIGGGVVSDLFEPEQRGTAMSIFSAGPLFGPVLGPLCGGFIAQRAGWRWVSNHVLPVPYFGRNELMRTRFSGFL
jgi:multidrug resistance protein